MALRLLDVLRPSGMAIDGVYRKADDFHPALVKLGLELRHIAQFRRANGREILRVREQNAPLVAEPLVEVNPALSRFRFEVRRNVVDAQSHVILASCSVRGDWTSVAPRFQEESRF